MCMSVPRASPCPQRDRPRCRDVDDRRPEQAVLADARVEISDLCPPELRVVDVNSYEAERRTPHVAVTAPEHSLHEPHVIEQIRQRSGLPRPAIVPLDCTTDERDRARTGKLFTLAGSESGPNRKGGPRTWDCTPGKNSTVVGIGSTSPMPGPEPHAAPGRISPAPRAVPATVARVDRTKESSARQFVTVL